MLQSQKRVFTKTYILYIQRDTWAGEINESILHNTWFLVLQASKHLEISLKFS
jgi:hypothetical protein